MSIKSNLLFNREKNSHADELQKHLKQANKFDALIAFAKSSGLKDLDIKLLRQKLDKGLSARIIVGGDFFITDPSCLEALNALSKNKKHDIKVYLMPQHSGYAFHPKVYAFEKSNGYAVIVGSANLTRGGLNDNFEASIMLTGSTSQHFKEVQSYIDNLIQGECLNELSQEQIADYRRRHKIFRDNYKVADQEGKKTINSPQPGHEHLKILLTKMRQNSAAEGFVKQIKQRDRNRNRAKQIFKKIISTQKLSPRLFRPFYEELIAKCFHSGGIERQKNSAILTPKPFKEALRALINNKKLSVQETYNLILPYFKEMGGAGTNVMTEVLHALDNKKFAVMNQNSVAGLEFAGFTGYPKKPTKQNLTGVRYERFCHDMKNVRETLGLKNFTELDALFNYIYWQ